MKSMILALSLLAPLASAPPAERPAGSLRELRVVENSGRTEIVVRVAGEPRYRLFRSLSDPVNPRITLEVYDAEAAGLASRYPEVRRGGVRDLRLTPTDSGTIQLVVGLANPGERAFGVVKRDGAIVVWMRNQDGPFAPWSSGGAPAVATEAKAAAAPAPRPEVARPAKDVATVSGPALGTSPRAEAAAAAVTEPGPVAFAGGAVEASADIAEAELVGVDGDASEASGAAAAAVGIGARVRALAGRAADAIRQARPAAIDAGIVVLLALAVLPVLFLTHRAMLSPATAASNPSGTTERAGGLRRIPCRPAQPKPDRRLVARARGAAASSPDARLWTVRTLAARGASHAEIARSTGLSRDAVALIVRSAAARSGGRPVVEDRVRRPDAEGSAGTGTFFRPAEPSRRVAAAGVGYWKVVM